MKVFIVYAHQEPKSFNGALKDLAIDYFQKKGHEVLISDLYKMEFNPIASPSDFKNISNPHYFKYSQEQTHASTNCSLANDITEEHKKLMACDLLIIQFPLWWYGFPAILKGWMDRVITKGNLYDDDKIYDRGLFQKKRAFFSLTTGGTPNPTVNHHDIETIINYLNHGILYFLGFEVLKSFITFSPARMTHENRFEKLQEYKSHLQNLSPIHFAPLHQTNNSHHLLCSSNC